MSHLKGLPAAPAFLWQFFFWMMITHAVAHIFAISFFCYLFFFGKYHRTRTVRPMSDLKSDPLIALDYFRSKPKENAMVISDVRMPRMNRLELVPNMKEIEPKIKVIFMTAYDIDNIKRELQKHNYEIEEIFQKPLSMITLCEKVRKHLAEGK